MDKAGKMLPDHVVNIVSSCGKHLMTSLLTQEQRTRMVGEMVDESISEVSECRVSSY